MLLVSFHALPVASSISLLASLPLLVPQMFSSALLQELFPGNYLPTPTHYFMRLLHDKGLLLRCYTQVG